MGHPFMVATALGYPVRDRRQYEDFLKWCGPAGAADGGEIKLDADREFESLAGW
jgi:hypothetical protein